MKKNSIRYTIIIIILLIVFNVLVFAIPFSNKCNAAFWIAYAFGDLAILSQLGFAYLAFKGKDTLKSKFYGLPIVRIGFIYFIVQIILSILIFIINCFVVIPMWIILVLLVLLVGIASIGLIVTDAYRDEVERQDVNSSINTKFMSDLALEVNLLVNKYSNTEYKDILNTLQEEVRYSDPTSNKSLDEIDNAINDKLLQVKTALTNNDANVNSHINELMDLIKNRNIINKSSK